MGLLLALGLLLQSSPSDVVAQEGISHLRKRAAEFGESWELVLFTLVRCSEAGSDAVERDLLERMLRQPPETTRSAALQAMTLLDLHDPRHRDRMAYCAQFLLDNQCGDGRWDAGHAVAAPELPPAPKPGVRDFGGRPLYREKLVFERKGKGAARGNPVDAAWAMKGLKACTLVGYQFPAEAYERAAAAWREESSGTAEQISALTFHLFQQGKEWKKDPDVRIGLHRMGEKEPPSDPRAWAALKTAMMHVGSETLGDRRWWPEGVKALLASRGADGGWGGIEETCAAIEFLVTPLARPPGRMR